MRNHLNLVPHLSQPTRCPPKTRLIASLLGLTIGWVGGLYPSSARAESAETAPPELKNLLTQIDAAANSQDVQAVMQFYTPNFTHSDGLSYQNLQQALSELWQRYPKLNYSTQLQSWQADGNGIVAETVTEIAGVQSMPDREVTLRATVRSRQRYENQKIVQQEILAERSMLTSGQNPPTLQLNLPDEIRIGQPYNFDAIVKEPLGEDMLLGAALEEPISAGPFSTPTKLELEPLTAGGIFKVGEAPTKQDSRWISAIIVRQDGMTVMSQRVRIIGTNSSKK